MDAREVDTGSAAESISVIGQYMDEIRRTPLLTHEQEILLSQRVEAGDAEAVEIMVRSNLRFVVSIARKYVAPGIELMDLIQEGNTGLIKAVTKYDWRLGFRFSTYAHWWISQALMRARDNQARTIRYPVHVAETLRKVHKARNSFALMRGYEPNRQELADELGVDVHVLLNLDSLPQVMSMTEITANGGYQAEITFLIQERFLNLASPVDIEEDVTTEVGRQKLMKVLREHLDEREFITLVCRYDLDGYGGLTFQVVGDMLGLSRERIRQIEVKALQKAREIPEIQVAWSEIF